MTEVLAPVSIVVIGAREPFIAKACVLTPPTPPSPPPEDDIFVPKPPGVVVDDLPELEPETQIIDTSPSRIIGCANELPTGLEQQVLNAFFPARIEGDGVVNRESNDIWVYGSGAWQNVGPTPGPTVVVVTVVPPWNEIVKVDAKTRTLLGVTLRDYALQLLTNLVVPTRTKVAIVPVRLVNLPISAFLVSTLSPLVRGGAARITTALTLITGTAAPVLGSNQVDPTFAVSSGWTLIFNSTADESSTQTTSFGFPFNLNGVSYTDCFVNSNSYITFGGQQNVYSTLSAASPSLPKIHIGSGDFSYQRVYTKAEAAVYRIRWEGNTSYSAGAGSSNRFFEINFYKQLENGAQYIEIRSGDINGFNPGPFMIATATTALASLSSGSFTSNQSWVFTGNATGTEWTLSAGVYMNLQASLNIKVSSATIQLNTVQPELEISLNVKPDAAGLSIQPLAPSLSTGASVAVPVSAVDVAASDEIEIQVARYINLQSANVILVALPPGVFASTSIAIAPIVIEVNAITPSTSAGASVATPTASISLNAGTPETLIGGDYWSDWGAQVYGWDADLYPDWWAN